MKTETLNIKGMMCQGCVAGATMALEDVEGVNDVKVSLENNNATITYDENKVTTATLAAAIKDAGFEVV